MCVLTRRLASGAARLLAVVAVAALLLGGRIPAAAAEAPLHPWHDQEASARQAVSVTCPVQRINPVVSITLAGPADVPLRIVADNAPRRPLGIYREKDGQVWMRLPGEVTPARPSLLWAYWSSQRGWTASPELTEKPGDTDDYATVTYGDAWDFDEGDQEGILHWGDRPTEYGKVEVKDGHLVIPVTGGDPYFIWGVMFGDPGKQRVEHIDSHLYRYLQIRLRQSRPQTRWSMFVTDTKGKYHGRDFAMRGARWQTVTLDLEEAFPEFWDGREFRALRIDTTNNAPGTTVQLDWVKLTRPDVSVRTGPVLTREQVKARALVRRVSATLPKSAEAGEVIDVQLAGLGRRRRRIPEAPLAVALRKGDETTGCAFTAADRTGRCRIRISAGSEAGEFEWTAGVCDDFGLPAGRVRTAVLLVKPGALHHYELTAEQEFVPVSRRRVKVTIQGADRFGNELPVDIRTPEWKLTGGASVAAGKLKGDPALTTITCSSRPLVRHSVTLRDSAGRSGEVELITMAYKKHPVTLSPNGYLVDAEGRLYLPLGGFYANWPAGFPAEGGAIRRAVDLFPCGPRRPYPHGFPWPAEVEKQVADFLQLCHRHGVTGLRLMLRNMDLVGRVDEVQLKAVLHLFDMARPLGIRFNVALLEDYTKPPYVDAKVLQRIVLPHYTADELRRLPAHRARFLVKKRLLSDAAQKYTDPDAIACQKDYLRQLLPHLAPREEIFCYEFENEMVRPPMSWVNEMTDYIRSIDPHTLVLGNPGPHRWPEPWRWRQAKMDLFSYHPYSDGQPNADHGTVVFARSKWAVACGVPVFTGEGGGNQNRWQKGTKRVPPEYCGRCIRDQVWLSLCCGACGAFMWAPEHELEMAEFGKVHPALKAAGIDLLKIKRLRPGTVLVMPEDETANRNTCDIAWKLLAAGVDFDTLPAKAAEGYRRRIDAAKPAQLDAAPELLRPSPGYQAAYLAADDLNQVLVYLRNAAGGIVNLGDGRPCYLRKPQPAEAFLTVVGKTKWKHVSAYDLDDAKPVKPKVLKAGRVIRLPGPSTHDYVVGLRR